MQVAVQLEDVQLLVVFELLRSVLGNLDDRPKDLGGTVADRQLQIINHLFLLLLDGLGSRMGPGAGNPSRDHRNCLRDPFAGTYYNHG